MWVLLGPAPDHPLFATALGLPGPLEPLLGFYHLASQWVWPEVQLGMLAPQLPDLGVLRVGLEFPAFTKSPLSKGEEQGVYAGHLRTPHALCTLM